MLCMCYFSFLQQLSEILRSPPFYRSGKWGIERLNNLPKALEMVNGRGWAPNHYAWLFQREKLGNALSWLRKHRLTISYHSHPNPKPTDDNEQDKDWDLSYHRKCLPLVLLNVVGGTFMCRWSYVCVCLSPWVCACLGSYIYLLMQCPSLSLDKGFPFITKLKTRP